MSDDQDLIAEFIHKRGVTKCPVAAVAPTSASIPTEHAAVHQMRGPDPVGDAWRKKSGRGGWTAYWAKKRKQVP